MHPCQLGENKNKFSVFAAEWAAQMELYFALSMLIKYFQSCYLWKTGVQRKLREVFPARISMA